MKILIYGDIEHWILNKKIVRFYPVGRNSHFDVIIPEIMILCSWLMLCIWSMKPMLVNSTRPCEVWSLEPTPLIPMFQSTSNNLDLSASKMLGVSCLSYKPPPGVLWLSTDTVKLKPAWPPINWLFSPVIINGPTRINLYLPLSNEAQAEWP